MAQLSFNAQNVAPDQGRDPIPADVYNMKIVKSELKPTSNGAGLRLNLSFEVIDGPFAGRRVVEGLNIQHTSPQAQQIAQGQLSAICHATGVLNLNDSVQLHNIPLKVKVKVKPASSDGQYEARNEVTAYRNINDNSLSGGVNLNAPAAPQAPTGFGAQQAAQTAPQQPAFSAQQAPQQPWAQPAQEQAAQQAAPVAHTEPAPQAQQTQVAPGVQAGVAPWAQA